MSGITIFDSWFRVDAKPFKQALLNIIKRWSFMFKQHLIDHVTNRYMRHAAENVNALFSPFMKANEKYFCNHCILLSVLASGVQILSV